MVNSYNNNFAVLNCTALGGPDNVYIWTRLSDGIVVANTSVLRVMVKSAHDGSIYQCTIRNNAGNISSNATLNGKQLLLLLVLLICPNILLLSTVAPVILVPPSSLNVTFMNESINLSCNASGFPVPTISWYHNGTDINITAESRQNITRQEQERSILSILVVNAKNVTVNDSGVYVCSVSSSITEFRDTMSNNYSASILVQGNVRMSVMNNYMYRHVQPCAIIEDLK